MFDPLKSLEKHLGEFDFNSRVPFYNDSSDYTTNAPSYYDDLARKNKLIKHLAMRIWDYDKELAKRFAAWDKNLEEFDDEVLRLLHEWMSDGTFDEIINETIFGELNGRVGNVVNIFEYEHLVEDGNWKPAFDKAISELPEGYTLYFPKNDYWVSLESGRGLELNGVQNISLRFDKNANVRGLPTELGGYATLILYRVKNVSVYHGGFYGERNEHPNDADERGHSIRIQESEDVYLHKPYCADAWGDGIYIAKTYEEGNLHNDGIEIYEPVINNARRNGIAVCDGINKGITITRPKIYNINGTSPEAGIDIEPEGENTRMDYLNIIDPYTENCGGNGIEINFRKMMNRGLSTITKITNHVDQYSNKGMGSSTMLGELSGSIEYIDGVMFENRTNGIQLYEYGIDAPTLQVVRPQVINPNSSGQTRPHWGAGIVLRRRFDQERSDIFGNVHFFEPTVIDNREYPKMTEYFHFSDELNGTINTMENVKVIDPLELYGATLNHPIFFRTFGDFTDKHNQAIQHDNYFEWNVGYSYYSKRTNRDVDEITTYTLGSVGEGDFPAVELQCLSTYRLRVKPPTGSRILPIAPNGETIHTNQMGASCKFKKYGDDWIMENVVGEWSVVT